MENIANLWKIAIFGYKKLPDVEAAVIQDSLGQFIAECIKNASKEYENEEQE